MNTETQNRGFALHMRDRAMDVMNALVAPDRRWRLAFAILLIALLGYFFWTGSRYPDLNDKAIMGGAIQLEDSLSFETVIEVRDEQSVAERVIYTTLNWVKTNRKGMTFGVLFGAAFLTFLSYLLRRNFRNGFANAGMGMLMGAPLGVCVNCAAPIAKGFYAGGSRAEVTLAAMIASPSLNVVVLFGMLLPLVPLYFVITKLILTFLLILIGVPLIARALDKKDLQVSEADGIACPIPEPPQRPGEVETLLRAAQGFAADYGRNLWFILRMTVPLMLLAGFLGALVGILVPTSFLEELSFGPFGLTLAALIGTFAPVPIGFDAAFSIAALGGGLPVGYVMTLLFTLGAFSIYSFLIVANTISLRAALLTAAAVAALGIAGGGALHAYHHWQHGQAVETLGEETAFLEPGLIAEMREL